MIRFWARRMVRTITAIGLSWIVCGCLPVGTVGIPDPSGVAPTQTSSPSTLVSTILPATACARAATLATRTATSSRTPTSAPPPCELLGLNRPLASGAQLGIDPTYRFGSTQNGLRDAHHGVEFYNSEGTPVLAAGGGRVVFAGADTLEGIGPTPGFYGNVVILEMDPPSIPPLFTLYGHLSSVRIATGDQVHPGQEIGTVGATGYATGAHLHFEVRVGRNSYSTVENPELWLAPLEGRGALAGRFPARAESIELHPLELDGGLYQFFYLQPYAFPKGQMFAHSILQEDFALTDVPAGLYQATVVAGTVRKVRIRIFPGRLSWLVFDDSPPPPSPCLN